MLRSRFTCYCILCSLIGLFLAWLLFIQPPAAQAQGGKVSFINDVAPILRENCFACHDAKKKKGKFEMTTFETILKGGTKEDIVPGKPKESILIDLLTSKGKDRMPPPDIGAPLAPEKIALIARWIEEGAKLDAGIDPKADLMRELRIRWKPPLPHAAYAKSNLINALAFTPDNKKLVVGGFHELMLWDIASGKLDKRIYIRPERVKAMAFLPDGKLALAGSRPGQEGNVNIYDLNAGSPKKIGGGEFYDGVTDKSILVKELFETDDEVLCLAISADGKKMAAAGCDRLVKVWDISGGIAAAKLEASIENHADWVFGVAFSPDGKYLLTCSRDKTAKVWDLAAKESLLTFPDHQNGVYGVAITADGKTGISCGEDNNIRMWQATEQSKQLGKQSKLVTGHGKAVFKLASDQKNSLLASCSADGTVRLWNPSGGTAVKTLSGFSDWVYAVAVSPNAEFVAGGDYSGEVRIWKTADGNQVQSFNASPGLILPKSQTPKK